MYPLIIPYSPFPDLVIDDFSVEYLPKEEGSPAKIQLTAQINNMGYIDITTSFQVSFFGIAANNNPHSTRTCLVL